MIIKSGSLGLVNYQIHDVRGDGHCFYRALYQILQDAENEVKEDVAIDDVDDEDDGVENIRWFVAEGLRSRIYDESMNAIDTLCSLVLNSPADERYVLQRELHEMYPFLTDDVCAKKGIQRYNLVANKIENMDKPMYASSMEIDQVKVTLSRPTGANIMLLTINANGNLQSAEKKWKSDLVKLLENSTTLYVAVLLNVDNIHYQYLKFQAISDKSYHAIVKRTQLLHLIKIHEEIDVHKLNLDGSGKKAKSKFKLR